LSTAGDRSSTTVSRLSMATLRRITLMPWATAAAADDGVTRRCRLGTCINVNNHILQKVQNLTLSSKPITTPKKQHPKHKYGT